MKTIPTGGKTPLGHGLALGFDTLMREKILNPGTKPIMIILSDGKTNVSTSDEEPMEDLQKIAEAIRATNMPAVVIDSERGLVKLGFAQKLAKMLGSKYLKC